MSFAQKFKRVIVVAPTRSTCVNLQHMIGLESLPETLIQRECGPQLASAIIGLPNGGFGIVAGTGTGKSAAIRQACQKSLGKTRLSVGVVTQEHKATGQSHDQDVLVITPGVAVMWTKSKAITSDDLVVLDEVHQTSEHLELAMALLKKAGCTFVWMSATIDPNVYSGYLGAREVIECSAYDPDRRADVFYHAGDTPDAVLDSILQEIADDKRGVAVFVPSQKDAEKIAEKYNGRLGIYADFYHGGASADKLKQFIEGTTPVPYIIAMTTAGASSLNITGLDTVVIVDAQFKEIITGGKRQLQRVELDPNTILQMLGRVDGRAVGGRAYIVSNRRIDVRTIRPVAPSFVLGGDLDLLAMTTARMGVDVFQLDLIGGVDEAAYRRTFDRLVNRGLITMSSGKPALTSDGKKIEALPLNVQWGEVVIRAQALGNTDLLLTTCLAASAAGDIRQLTGKSWDKQSDRLVVQKSEHLTAYNIVANALRCHGSLGNKGYRMDGKSLNQLCQDGNYSAKGIRNVVMTLDTLLQQLKVKLPEPEKFQTVQPGDRLHGLFVELIAAVQSMEYVAAPTNTVKGNERNGVTDGYSILGAINHWTNARGQAGQTITGTHIPADVVQRNARRVFDSISDEGDDGKFAVSYLATFAGVALQPIVERLALDELPHAAYNQLQWQQWSDRPAVKLPNLTDVTATVPQIIDCAYGTDAENGQPLVAYGTVEPNQRHDNESDPYFLVLWTRDYDQAERSCEWSADYLVTLHDYYQSAGDDEKAIMEAAQLRDDLEPLSSQIQALCQTHDGGTALPWNLRGRLHAIGQPPATESLNEVRSWMAAAEAMINEVNDAMAMLAARKAAFDARQRSS